MAAAEYVPFVVHFGRLATVGAAMRSRLTRHGYHPIDPPGIKSEHRFEPATSTSLTGGARVGRMNASVPLVTLVLDEQGAHLSQVGARWIARDGVTYVSPVRRPFRWGLRFNTEEGDLDGLIFWTFNPHHARSTLAGTCRGAGECSGTVSGRRGSSASPDFVLR